MCGYSSSKRATETANFSFDTQIFNGKLENGFCVVKGIIRIRRAFRPAVRSIVPHQNIGLHSHEKLKPKGILRVDILLVNDSVRVEEYHGGVLQVLRRALVFQLTLQYHFFLIKRKELAVQIDLVLCSTSKTSPIKVLDQHFFHLLIGMEYYLVKQAKAACAATAQALDRLYNHFDQDL